MKTLTSITLLGALLLTGMPALADDALNGAAARVTLATGKITVAGGDGTIREIARGDLVHAGEILSTASNSYLHMRFSDGGQVVLRPNSRFVIDEYLFDEDEAASTEEEPEGSGSSSMRLLRGGFRAVTGAIGRNNQEDYEVKTPVATLGIRGTNYQARMCAGDCVDIDPMPDDGLYAGVDSGAISITNAAGETIATAGQYAYVAGAGEPPSTLPFRPRVLTQDPIPDPDACE